ncbi:MAG: DUF4258 domain-containing protein [Acidobacteriota bacterium]|nr:DUF4258 domain-containing protein [Acidobacteriota bacterium]
MEIESIRDRVRDGNYLIKSHAVQHALKEGFERQQMVEAVLEGIIIEEYLDDQRVLICGKTMLSENLDIVCEYADPVYVEFVTAYIPDELGWESPPLRRRKQKRQ